MEQEFEPDINNVQRYGKEVRREIELAKAQADRQDQELRRKESEATTGYWHKVRDKLSLTGSELETIKEWQLQQDKRRLGKLSVSFIRGSPNILQESEDASYLTRYHLMNISPRSSVLAKRDAVTLQNVYFRLPSFVYARKPPSLLGYGARGRVCSTEHCRY